MSKPGHLILASQGQTMTIPPIKGPLPFIFPPIIPRGNKNEPEGVTTPAKLAGLANYPKPAIRF